ncbi:WxL domain-containing protein [Lederbergia lenta]|uniref:WxL domain-containing protein n=1 Tax=Lederbergia lenta TaxID=1467 RepID=UPI00203CDBB7|nr:WxL domain-containing protein [Lederbergia lenta]MCM3113645.1 WxL domain-containing protein [Lederbergia lenta]
MKKGLLGLCIIPVLTLSFTSGAFAAAPTDTKKANDLDITIEGGEFSLATSDILSFGQVVLEDQPKTYETSFANKFTVKDLRGSQAGWRIDVSATPFTDGTNTLPKGSLSLNPISNIERVGTGKGILPVKATTTNRIIDDGTVTIAKAESGTGMGVFDLVFPEKALSIVIDPTTAKIKKDGGKYQSTLTWNLVQAP